MAQSLMVCLVLGESVQSLTFVYTVSKSPRPAPSSHWTLLLILDAGTREPLPQRFVARNIARVIRAVTNTIGWEGASGFREESFIVVLKTVTYTHRTLATHCVSQM